MAKCWFWNHHWHRFKTTLIWKSADCAGETLPWYRCCRCRITRSGVPSSGALGEWENDRAHRLPDDAAIHA